VRRIPRIDIRPPQQLEAALLEPRRPGPRLRQLRNQLLALRA
jgi:hypothetical protein